MDNKVLVFSTKTEHLAHLVKGALEANGIETIMLDKHDSTQMQFGIIELFIAPENAENAQAIIAANQESE